MLCRTSCPTFSFVGDKPRRHSNFYEEAMRGQQARNDTPESQIISWIPGFLRVKNVVSDFMCLGGVVNGLSCTTPPRFSFVGEVPRRYLVEESDQLSGFLAVLSG